MKNMKKSLAAIVCMFMVVVSVAGCKSFDATGYVKGYLDTIMKGECAEYAKICEVEESEAEKVYQEQIDVTVQGWTTGFDLSDELKGKYEQLVKDLLKKTKYEVKEAKKDGKNFTVDVEIEPLKLNLTEDEITQLGTELATQYQETHETIDQAEFMTFLAEEYYNFISEKAANCEYGEKTTVTVAVQLVDNKYTLSTTDQQTLANTLFAE